MICKEGKINLSIYNKQGNMLVRDFKYHDKMNILFDKKAKEINFVVVDLVVKWDKHKEDPGKHGKFDPLWSGPFIIEAIEGKMNSHSQISKERALDFLLLGVISNIFWFTENTLVRFKYIPVLLSHTFSCLIDSVSFINF